MILPTKHISLSESIFGLAGILLKNLNNPKTIDELWCLYSKKYNEKPRFPAYHNFDNIVLAINLLYAMGVIDINEKGELLRCDYYDSDQI